jgi:hypothetical protein
VVTTSDLVEVSNHDMNTLYLSLLILLWGAIAISCETEESIPDPGSVSPVIETDLPPTGTTGEQIAITVSHVVSDGCGYYSSQRTVQSGNTFIVTFYAKYREGPCTYNIPVLKTPYTFTPVQEGTYTFKFKGVDGTYLTQTIVVH